MGKAHILVILLVLAGCASFDEAVEKDAVSDAASLYFESMGSGDEAAFKSTLDEKNKEVFERHVEIFRMFQQQMVEEGAVGVSITVSSVEVEFSDRKNAIARISVVIAAENPSGEKVEGDFYYRLKLAKRDGSWKVSDRDLT